MRVTSFSVKGKFILLASVAILLLGFQQISGPPYRINLPSKLRQEKPTTLVKPLSELATEIAMIELEANPKVLIGKTTGLRVADFGFVVIDDGSNKPRSSLMQIDLGLT